jgi:hypothetical protein
MKSQQIVYDCSQDEAGFKVMETQLGLKGTQMEAKIYSFSNKQGLFWFFILF